MELTHLQKIKFVLPQKTSEQITEKFKNNPSEYLHQRRIYYKTQ